MIITAILIIVYFIGLSLANSYGRFMYLGILIMSISITYFIAHIFLSLTASYKFDEWVFKRNYFIETIDKCRKKNNNVENTILANEIIESNQELSFSLVMNKNFFMQYYIDDRFELFKPIK